MQKEETKGHLDWKKLLEEIEGLKVRVLQSDCWAAVVLQDIVSFLLELFYFLGASFSSTTRCTVIL